VDRSELLRSLSIDRSAGAETEGGSSLSPLLIAGIVAGALVIGGTLGWVVKPAPKVKPVVVAAAPMGTNKGVVRPGGLTASGYVVARTRATIASEVTGRVVEVRVEEGQAVKAGQVLAILDGSLAKVDAASSQARALSAQAAADSAQAQYVQAQRDLARYESLASTGYVSDANVQAARLKARVAQTQAALSQAQMVAAQSDANRSRVQLGKYEIRAPFTGIVIDKAAQPGEIISPLSAGGGFTRTGICTIVDMDSIEIEVDVNEAYIGRVSEGQKVEAVMDAYPDTVLAAYVIAKIPTASRDKATVRVRIGFDGKDARILPEMAVKVTFLDAKS
jgi:HlyD family secretion protein